MPVQSGTKLSHYRLDRKLGQGGMGEVWLAEDLALGRKTAIKLLSDELSGTLRARLRREAEASSRLQHPGIATFFETGEEAGSTWLAMEYVDGPTLRRRLEKGPIAFDQALPIAAGLLEALVHAHTAGILHRDIKPENIILTGERRAKLLDFGLAKWIDEGPEQAPDESQSTATILTALTEHGAIAGTLGYMSPEQLRGEAVDHRTDLFAVGAVLHELLTGEAAFPGDTPRQRMIAVLSTSPPPLTDPEIPTGINDVILKALARDAADRYDSASSLLADLRRTSQGLAVADVPNTLAVLPFDNVSGNPDDSWIGVGVAESLVADLGRVSGVKLLPQEKVQAAIASQGVEAAEPLRVGRMLGCHFVLTGSVQRLGPSVRVTTCLSETGTGEIVATEKIDGKVDDLFAIQDRIATAVVGSLDLTAGSTRTEPRLDAFECYNRGKALLLNLGKEKMKQAAEYYERALELDPDFVPALADLTTMHAMRFSYTTDPDVLDVAIGYARRAIERDPSNGVARVWLGYSLWRQERHDEALARELEAVELAPDFHMAPYFAATILMDMCRLEEALRYAQMAVKLNPGLGWGWGCLTWCHLASGDAMAATWSAERCVAARAEPGALPYPLAFSLLAECQRRNGKLEGARESALRGLEEIEQTDHVYRDSGRAAGLSVLGRVALDQGDLDAARVAFDQAVAQIKGRPAGLGAGHLMVQSLAGQTRAGVGAGPFEEALELFERRERFNFSWILIGSNEVSLNELARAAKALGREEAARELFNRARKAGSTGLLEEGN